MPFAVLRTDRFISTVAFVGIATSAFPDPYLNIFSGFITSIVILLVYALGVATAGVIFAVLAGGQGGGEEADPPHDQRDQCRPAQGRARRATT